MNPSWMALLAVFDPNEGGGLAQTILASIVLVAITVLAAFEKDIPQPLVLFAGLMAGYFFTSEAHKNLEKKV